MAFLKHRPILYIGVFLLVVWAGDRMFAQLLHRLVARSEFRYSREYFGDAAADILILGDSRGVHSFFVPELQRETGQRVFNLSFNGMPTRGAECLLADYLDRHEPPKLIIVEVTSVEQPNGAIANLRPYVAESQRLSRLYAEEFPTSYYGLQLSHLYRYNCETFFRICYYLGKSDQAWIMTNKINDDLLAASEKESRAVPLKEGQTLRNLDALARIAALAKEKNIETRFVIAPYLPSYRRNTTNWSEAMESFTEAASTERIWDYSLALQDSAQFADRKHLNQKGAEAFADKLMRDRFFETEHVLAATRGVAP